MSSVRAAGRVRSSRHPVAGRPRAFGSLGSGARGRTAVPGPAGRRFREQARGGAALGAVVEGDALR
ncbi:hypothetical protein, partial [Nocardiopsis dassonvillei]|uniref:hypothetical protein n=1 Tax=Nocardiopsis dassonvillei TaxID=2014 RepID=UPI00200ED6CA